MRPAVFLDRDGTIIEHVHYLDDPAQVRLLPGAAEAIRALRTAGFACVMVTNQSAIGRGLLTLERFDQVQEEVFRQLREQRADLDGTYFCPVVPVTDNPTVVEHPDRKPGPGMLLRAARELDLDVSRSWMVGDALSDVFAGRNAGCCGTVLVRTGCGASAATSVDGAVDHVVADLCEAARLIVSFSGDPSPGSPRMTDPLLSKAIDAKGSRR